MEYYFEDISVVEDGECQLQVADPTLAPLPPAPSREIRVHVHVHTYTPSSEVPALLITLGVLALIVIGVVCSGGLP